MYLIHELKEQSAYAPIREHFSLDQIEFATNSEQGSVVGHYKDLSLQSHFQPIFSLAHKRAVGYEALLRARKANGEPVSPLIVFDMPENERETILLDRLSRNLHVRNFSAQSNSNNWLFLNVDPLMTVKGCQYGPFFKELLLRYNIPAHRTVVEILESSIDDEFMLIEAVKFYKDLGCLVAIDDFGAGHSNFDRIWRLSPEIVKLDRSIIVQAEIDIKIRRILPNLIKLIHESGSLSLIEGVETEQQALIAMDSGVDFIQGFYFGKPSKTLKDKHNIAKLMPDLCHKIRLLNEGESNNYHHRLKSQIELFQKTLKLIKKRIEPNIACLALLHSPLVKRCYLLDSYGKQIGPTLISPQFDKPHDPRMKPLQDAEDAIWARRSYFRQAVENFAKIQLSGPYLSIADANVCLTLSISFHQEGKLQVLCCDVDWDEAEKISGL